MDRLKHDYVSHKRRLYHEIINAIEDTITDMPNLTDDDDLCVDMFVLMNELCLRLEDGIPRQHRCDCEVDRKITRETIYGRLREFRQAAKAPLN